MFAQLMNAQKISDKLSIGVSYNGTLVLEGEGAGEGPTSSSVLSDVVDYAMGIKHHLFNKKYINLSDPASHKNFIERCKYKIALLGGRGYVGQEIIKLLNSHPLFDLSMAFSKSLAVCSY